VRGTSFATRKNTDGAARQLGTEKMILFVEDDSLSRRAFAQILRAKGYQVAEAGNGAEALEILTTGAEVLTNEPFDLVIADLVLPGLHGVNLVHQIRARWPKMPIIVISGIFPTGREKLFWKASQSLCRSRLIQPL
jgi:two-component system, cell cycle sensor histidine kinase and response regulator CckA